MWRALDYEENAGAAREVIRDDSGGLLRDDKRDEFCSNEMPTSADDQFINPPLISAKTTIPTKTLRTGRPIPAQILIRPGCVCYAWPAPPHVNMWPCHDGNRRRLVCHHSEDGIEADTDWVRARPSENRMVTESGGR